MSLSNDQVDINLPNAKAETEQLEDVYEGELHIHYVKYEQF